MTISPKFVPRLLRGLLRWKTWEPVPLFASFIVTGRCNLKCAFCQWPSMKAAELNTQEALLAVDRLCHLGVPFLHFAGGEPMLRSDLCLLAQRASDHGCIVGVNTNGTLLDASNVSEVADSFNFVSVSLDGPQELHDKYRGVPGTFEKAIEAIRLLEAENVRVGVNIVVAPWNIAVLPPLVEWLQGRVDFVTLQPIHPYPPPSYNTPPINAVQELVHYLLEVKQRHPRFLTLSPNFIKGFEAFFRGGCSKICQAGGLYVAVDSTGELIPCAIRADIPLGNILEHLPEDLLHEKSKNCEWNKIETCKGCWLLCTSQASMIMQNPLKEAVYLSGTVL